MDNGNRLRVGLGPNASIRQGELEEFLVKAGTGRIKARVVSTDGANSVVELYSKTDRKGSALPRLFSYLDRRERRGWCAKALTAAFKQTQCESFRLEQYCGRDNKLKTARRDYSTPDHDLKASQLLELVEFERKALSPAPYKTAFIVAKREFYAHKAQYKWGENAIATGSYGKVFVANDAKSGDKKIVKQVTLDDDNPGCLKNAQSERSFHKMVSGQMHWVRPTQRGMSRTELGRHSDCPGRQKPRPNFERPKIGSQPPTERSQPRFRGPRKP